MDIDLEELMAMVELLKSAEFSEFRYEKGDLRIVIRRGNVEASEDERPVRASASEASRVSHRPPQSSPPAPPSPPASSPAPIPTATEGVNVVTAPLLGTFYARPKPGDPPFAHVGDRVEPDTVLCIIEVMKLMNSVNAGCRGVISAIHADDGDLVEFGQALYSIVPSAT